MLRIHLGFVSSSVFKCNANWRPQWGAAIFEWVTTWLLIQKDGKVFKDDLRGLYDVSMLYRYHATLMR